MQSPRWCRGQLWKYWGEIPLAFREISLQTL